MIRVSSPSGKPHKRASLGHSIKPTELQRVPKPNKSEHKQAISPIQRVQKQEKKKKKNGKKRRPTRRRRRHSLLG